MGDMTKKELATVAALTALGAMWRADWSDFDGRTLRSQLESVTTAIEQPEDEAMRALEELAADWHEAVEF